MFHNYDCDCKTAQQQQHWCVYRVDAVKLTTKCHALTFGNNMALTTHQLHVTCPSPLKTESWKNGKQSIEMK